MMRTKLLLVFLGLLVGMMAIAGPAAAGVNQGDPGKVLRVDNASVWCKDPVPGTKIEGDLTTTIKFRAAHPIALVTVKSGKDARVVSYSFDTYHGTITLSKDVSNYVVWTCPGFDKKNSPPAKTTDPPKTGPDEPSGTVNQGDPGKVLRVDNASVWCKDPVPGTKIEGDLTTTIKFRAAHPIALVTVKSGKDARVVSYSFDTYHGTITLSKDVSNYVVWTCPGFDKKNSPPANQDRRPHQDDRWGQEVHAKRVSLPSARCESWCAAS